MMTTFVVSGMGRSGTKALAHYLNQSRKWTVKHEPEQGFHSVRELQQRFNRQDCYGEVNSWLRIALVSLDVDRKLVILRHPMEIAQSMYNRGETNFGHLDESLHVLDAAVQSGIEPVSFTRMVRHPAKLAQELKIYDVPDEALVQRNASRLKQMPSDLKCDAERVTAWFVREYGDRF